MEDHRSSSPVGRTFLLFEFYRGKVAVTGHNVTCAIIGYPQRGPVRIDGCPTLSVTYCPSKIHQNSSSSHADSVEAAKAVLRTLQLMLVPKMLPKSRILCRVISVQQGSNVSQSDCTLQHTVYSCACRKSKAVSTLLHYRCCSQLTISKMLLSVWRTQQIILGRMFSSPTSA